MTPAKIIETIGDTAKVADDLDTTVQVVSNWKLRGIPRSRMLDIVEAAARAGHPEITGEIVRKATAPRPVVAQAEAAN